MCRHFREWIAGNASALRRGIGIIVGTTMRVTAINAGATRSALDAIKTKSAKRIIKIRSLC